MSRLRRLILLLGVMALTQQFSQSVLAEDPAIQPSAMKLDLRTAKSWGYQLQSMEPTVLATTSYDLLVIDYSLDGTEPISPEDLALLSHKPDGSRRIVLCYMSIGEAEDYRFYWNARWATRPPAWLGKENPEWPGNYKVRYWDRDWQGIIFGGPGAYLDRVIQAGFDGVYLDRVDAFDTADPEHNLPERFAVMSRFVQAIADYARSRAAGFLVVVQNGEELLSDEDYRNAIDGLAKEDLFYGIDGDGIPNAKADIRASLTPIEDLIAVGKPVFLVEYLNSADQIELVRENAGQIGMPLFIADRELDHAQSR